MSLNNLGHHALSELGRREEALAASAGGGGPLPAPGAGRPDAFLPDSGESLNNLGHDV